MVSRHVPKELGKSLADLCREHNQDYECVQGCLRRGWSLEEALGLVPRVSPAVVRKDRSAAPIDIRTPYTQAGINLMAAAAGLLTGEE